jgi:endonuclease YncB( thermonuclease family)
MRPLHPRSLLLWLLIVAAVAYAAHRTGRFGARPPGTSVSTAPMSGAARIIDGDSLEVGGVRIRIFGIDAPEYRQQCRNARGESYACGREARRALDRLIGGRIVTCTPVSHDRYERDVAACAVIGRDLGDAMVRAGHAVDYARHSGGRYAAAEQEARAAKRGIWAGEFEMPEAWRRREAR